MAKQKPVVTMEFMVGLPGSGKTTLSKELERKSKGKAKRIDFDKTFELSNWRHANEKEKERIVRGAIVDNMQYRCPERFLMDGLFLTHEDIVRVVAATFNYFSHINIGVYLWNEDRETCVKNDGGRREASSTTTILNAKFDGVINNEKLIGMLKDRGCNNVTVNFVKSHNVQLKPDWERYFRGKTYVWEDGKIRSDKWCTGGSYGSCWGDKLSPVEPDDQPEFEELDELLLEICPNVTFLQYKKIMRSCVEFEETYESDYYSGGCNYKRYACDVEKLYSALKEFGYDVNAD